MRHQIIWEYDDELKGLGNYLWMWHNKNDDESKYNFWNFTRPKEWDDYTYPDNMWYHPNHTALASTVPYKIGYESIEKINLELEPIKFTH